MPWHRHLLWLLPEHVITASLQDEASLYLGLELCPNGAVHGLHNLLEAMQLHCICVHTSETRR